MEFQVNGVKYRSSRLNAFDQLHLFRKLMPILTAAGSIASTLKADDKGVLGLSMDAVQPLVIAIAEMPESDCNDILGRCLAAVQRGEETGAGTAWANLWSTSAKGLMYDDVDLISMIQIAVNVVQDNLGNFSLARLSTSIG